MACRLSDFFLSARPGILCGMGPIAKLVLSYCHVFEMNITCLVSLPDEKPTAVMRHGPVLSFPLSAISPSLNLREHDLLFALPEDCYSAITTILAEYKLEFASTFAPASWSDSLAYIKEITRKLYALYDEYDKYAMQERAQNATSCPPARKRLVIHAGMPKTGTTTLQKFLFINRFKLKKLGFYYKKPLVDEDKHKEMLLRYKHLYYEDLLQTRLDPILSAEYFIRCNINDFKIFLKRFRPLFIIYLREPFGFAQSYMLHHARTRPANVSQLPLPCFRLYSYMALQLDLLESFFNGTLPSRKLVILRPFLPADDLWLVKDFCQLVGIAFQQDFIMPARQNISLPLDFCFFMAHLWALPLREEEFFGIEDELQILASRQPIISSIWTQKFRLFSRRQIEQTPPALIHRYDDVGKRMDDPDFYERGREAMLKLEQFPCRQLPEDRQYEIFNQLSSQSQNAILRLWPLWQELPGKLRGSSFLPDIPEDEESARMMNVWARSHYGG